MEKKTANNIIVGFFVLAGFGGFVYVLFNIGGGSGIWSRNFTLQGRFHHVKGLNYGSEVSLSGLRIGTVQNIRVTEGAEKELITEMSVSRDMMDRIREDSVATIKTSGMLGDKYIEISIGSPQFPRLKDGAFIRTEEPPDLFSKTGGLMEDISKHFQKGGDLELLIKNLNISAANLATLTSEMRTQRGLWNEIVRGSSGEKLSRSLGHIEAALKKIDSGEGTLGALINDPTIYEDLKALLAGARRSSVLKYFMRSFIEEGSETQDKGKKK